MIDPTESTLDPITGSDDEFARLVDEITQMLQTAEPVEPEDYLSEFPALQTLVDLGLSASAPANDSVDVLAGPGDPVLGVLGDFRIIREIGRGGMGVVYEAQQLSLNRRVALKILPFAGMMDARHIKRFHNEALAAATSGPIK